MRPIAPVLAAALAAPALAGIQTSIYDTGSGFSPYSQEWSAKARNIASTNGDWEVGAGAGGQTLSATAHTQWPASGAISDFTLSYAAKTNLITFSFNGTQTSFFPTTDFNALTLQLVARNPSSDIAMSIPDLWFNGQPVPRPEMNQPYLYASSDSDTIRYLTLTDDAFASGADWTMLGKLQAKWSGSAPARDHARLDVMGSSIAAIGEPIPAPGAAAALALTALAGLRRRRPA